MVGMKKRYCFLWSWIAHSSNVEGRRTFAVLISSVLHMLGCILIAHLLFTQDLMRPHLMDPMHIEANVAKNLLHTILGKEGKDGHAVRSNCKAYKVQPDSWCGPNGVLPPAPWILTTAERRIFMERLSTMRYPTGYGAGFKYSFSNCDMPRGLKSHDYHCLLQHGFPGAIRGLLTPLVCKAIYALCAIFRSISLQPLLL